MKSLTWYTVLLGTLVFFLVNCGNSSSGGTETGTTETGTVETSTFATKLEAVGSSLVPSMTAGSDSSLSAFLTYDTSSAWDEYLDSDNQYLVTDIFGAADEDPQVVTKIRVLLSQLSGTVGDIFSSDEDFSCTDGEVLNEGDTIEIAFYGELANGTSENRFFDCLATTDSETIIYGEDSDGIIRVVTMSESTSTNTQDTATRGDEVTIAQTNYATYGEVTDADGNVSGYLDLQYVQATVYTGVDGSANTDDDVVFKSRSRIAGSAVLDADGNPTQGLGEFTVTKFDQSIDQSDNVNTVVTKTLGRGSYEEGAHSLFKIESEGTSLTAGTFCLEHVAEGLPAHADETNCSTFEADFAWGDDTIPFDFDPELVADFSAISFFEGDDTDMITNDLSNFSIPTYETVAE